MNNKIKKSFNRRAFVSILVGFSFVLMTVTGLVLFFAPSCRIARDTSWIIWGHDKEQWVAVHVWFSIAFVIASMFHIYLNWSALTSYFKAKLKKGVALRAEWILALVICGIIYAGTVGEVAPFSSLLTFKDTFKHGESGERQRGRGLRGGRAGEQQVRNYPNSGQGNLAGSSCDTQCQDSMSGMCVQNDEETDALDSGHGRKGRAWDLTGSGRNDEQQYSRLEREQAGFREEGRAQSNVTNTARYGMGQKTLRQFCKDEGIELSWAISRLRNEGFTVRETMTMREIADSAGMHPRQLRSILQVR